MKNRRQESPTLITYAPESLSMSAGQEAASTRSVSPPRAASPLAAPCARPWAHAGRPASRQAGPGAGAAAARRQQQQRVGVGGHGLLAVAQPRAEGLGAHELVRRRETVLVHPVGARRREHDLCAKAIAQIGSEVC
eukprot:4111291-Pleurochrysis_carterae.AAC.3